MSLAANLTALSRRIVGLAPNNLLALDDNGKLPAVDGSQLTNLQVPHIGFGVGAVPQSPSRALNTWYQNTTSDYIMVTVTVSASSGTYYARVGVSTTTYVNAATCGMSNPTSISLTFIVPSGYFYMVTGGNLGGWSEFRL